MKMVISDCICKSILYLINENKRIKKKYRNTIDNVILGRKFQLGVRFQYELAKQLFQNTEYLALVDSPISFKYRGKNKTLYPDILVLKENKLKGIIEVKIDLGYLKYKKFGISYNKDRSKKYSFNKRKNSFKKNYDRLIKSKEFSYILKKNGLKERKNVKIVRNVKKITTIATKNNDHGRYEVFEESMRNAGFILINILDKLNPNDDFCDVSAVKNEIKEKNEYFIKAFKGLLK
jgi:hypothetical protein